MFEMPKADVPMRLPAESGVATATAVPPRGWLPFNINHRVRVRLTPLGLAELRRQDDEICARLTASAAVKWRKHDVERYRPNADGHVEFQLWDLMYRLGHMMVMGCEPPIETAMLMETAP